MSNNYYEVVFEGHHKAIHGMLEGYKLAANLQEDFFFSHENNIKTETFTEVLLEWISLKNRLHHVILEENFYKHFKQSLEKYSPNEKKLIQKNIVKSAKKISNSFFQFKAKTFGVQYAAEIKKIIKNLPGQLELLDYKVKEEKDLNAKGVELYSPAHEYSFEATGKIKGDLKELISFREKLDNHPLIEVDKINILF